jgi:hypothetical protein
MSISESKTDGILRFFLTRSTTLYNMCICYHHPFMDFVESQINERNVLNRDFLHPNELFHINLHANRLFVDIKRKKQRPICFYFVYNYKMVKIIDDDEINYT